MLSLRLHSRKGPRKPRSGLSQRTQDKETATKARVKRRVVKGGPSGPQSDRPWGPTGDPKAVMILLTAGFLHAHRMKGCVPGDPKREHLTQRAVEHAWRQP